MNPDLLPNGVYGHHKFAQRVRSSYFSDDSKDKDHSLYGDFHPLAHAKKLKTPHPKEG